MSRETNHRKKKHHKDKNDDNEINRSKDRLFTEIDAKAADMSYDIMNYPISQTNPMGDERKIPLGVVEIDKSVKLPSPIQKSPNHDSKPHNIIRSRENHSREDVHLPPITRHQPYEYYDPTNPAHHFGRFSHPYPIYHQHQGHHHHHHHHNHHHHRDGHHHHHHHHRHHHRHEKEVETYDPRWWYMPIGSVHRPSSKKPVEYHYIAPKWYETPSEQRRMILISQEIQTPSARKYVDCRCEVCRPSKAIPRGIRWVASE